MPYAGRKGQSALEYMLTYGWAILVIILVGIMVWQLGILDMSKTTQKDSRGFSEMTLLDWVVGVDGEVDLVIQNNAGTMVDVDQVSADFMVGGVDGGGAKCTDWTDGITDFRPGSVQKITLENCGPNGDPGDYFKMNITIEYVNKASTLQHVSYGTLWGPLE